MEGTGWACPCSCRTGLTSSIVMGTRKGESCVRVGGGWVPPSRQNMQHPAPSLWFGFLPVRKPGEGVGSVEERNPSCKIVTSLRRVTISFSLLCPLCCQLPILLPSVWKPWFPTCYLWFLGLSCHQYTLKSFPETFLEPHTTFPPAHSSAQYSEMRLDILLPPRKCNRTRWPLYNRYLHYLTI